MDEWNLFNALSELDDELILTAQELPAKKHGLGRTGLRIALIAAVVTLLVGTALAVGLGVGIRHGQEKVTLQGLSLQQPDGEKTREMTYYTARVEYELQTVPVENMELLSACLTQAWESFPHDRSYFQPAELTEDSGERKDLESIRGAEEFLGLELAESPELATLVRGVYVSMVISDLRRAEEEYAQKGSITPDGLILYCSLRRGEASGEALDARTVSESGVTVYVALTEAFLEKEGTQCLYSYEREGPFHESGLMTEGGRSILLLENAPPQDCVRGGYAAWCENGIGYLAHMKVYPGSYATPLSLLTPLLQHLQ